MTAISAYLWAIVIALTSQVDANRYSAEAANPVIEARVTVADDVKLPAEEPGVLIHLAVKDGTQIRAGQELGRIDDSEPKLKKKAAEYGLAAALEKAKDDVEVKFQQASAAVYQAEYEQLLETNRLAAKAVTESDLRLTKLKWDQALLGIQKTQHDQELAKFEYYTKKAELDAAELAIQRRAITAPFNGVVEKLYRKQDEWVNPGDTILRLFRLDTMQVEGAVDQDQYDPHELQGCEVTVEVQMARERKETVRGRITYVSSLVRLDGKYVVRAEVANRQEHGNWMLRDGLSATMTIHLGTGGAAPVEVSRAP